MLDAQMRKAFGSRLRALRKQNHWTLKELAAKLSILPSQFNKYECGINFPLPEKLVEMADLFHTSVDFLLIGTPPEEIPLHNRRLLERFQALQSFPIEDQETVIKIIDAFVIKLRVEGALHPFSAVSPPPNRSRSKQPPSKKPLSKQPKSRELFRTQLKPAKSAKRSKSA